MHTQLVNVTFKKN